MEKSINTSSKLDQESLDHFKNILLKKRRNAEKELRRTTETVHILDSDNDPDYMPASDIPEAGSETQSDTMNYQLTERTRYVH
ncbi:MAG: hypothetical protein U5K71_12995 [Gracilimonas sp.]|nr:hypothetical protein [Gracilimonas sp.]